MGGRCKICVPSRTEFFKKQDFGCERGLSVWSGGAYDNHVWRVAVGEGERSRRVIFKLCSEMECVGIAGLFAIRGMVM